MPRSQSLSYCFFHSPCSSILCVCVCSHPILWFFKHYLFASNLAHQYICLFCDTTWKANTYLTLNMVPIELLFYCAPNHTCFFQSVFSLSLNSSFIQSITARKNPRTHLLYLSLYPPYPINTLASSVISKIYSKSIHFATFLHYYGFYLSLFCPSSDN